MIELKQDEIKKRIGDALISALPEVDGTGDFEEKLKIIITNHFPSGCSYLGFEWQDNETVLLNFKVPLEIKLKFG